MARFFNVPHRDDLAESSDQRLDEGLPFALSGQHIARCPCQPHLWHQSSGSNSRHSSTARLDSMS